MSGFAAGPQRIALIWKVPLTVVVALCSASGMLQRVSIFHRITSSSSFTSGGYVKM